MSTATSQRRTLGKKLYNAPGFIFYLLKVTRETSRRHWQRYAVLRSVTESGYGVDPTAILDIDSVSKIVLGQGVVVRRYVYLSALDHGTLTLEDGVYINEFNNIRAAGGDITIGSRTIIAQFVSIIATNHKIPPREQRVRDAGIEQEGSGVKIGRDVWIAANVVILPGVEVGDGAVIGAGAVVSKSIPAYAIAVGNPARVIRYR